MNRVPCWLSQRIAWYYSNKYHSSIINDLNPMVNDEIKEITDREITSEIKLKLENIIFIYL